MKRVKLFVLAVLCFGAVHAGASLLSINPTDAVGLNPWYGTWRQTAITGYYWGHMRAYLKFDLSPIADLAVPAGYELQINSVTFKAYGGDNIKGTVAFDDAMYIVTDTSWTTATLPDGYLPPLGDYIGSWSYVPWGWMEFGNDALKLYVQGQASSDDKQAAFCLKAPIDDTNNDRHQYYDMLVNGSLAVDYSFVIPEPATITMMGIGLTSLCLRRRKHG